MLRCLHDRAGAEPESVVVQQSAFTSAENVRSVIVSSERAAGSPVSDIDGLQAVVVPRELSPKEALKSVFGVP